MADILETISLEVMPAMKDIVQAGSTTLFFMVIFVK
jgi:hypothetical protein